jgi:hypothetical protein
MLVLQQVRLDAIPGATVRQCIHFMDMLPTCRTLLVDDGMCDSHSLGITSVTATSRFA